MTRIEKNVHKKEFVYSKGSVKYLQRYNVQLVNTIYI